MATIQPSNLFRLTTIIPLVAQPGDILWLIGSRKSSLGGYIGNFEHTYKHRGTNTYSPDGRKVPHIPMNLVTPF